MDEVPRVVDEVFAVLAERFGATGAHLWGVLVRQAYVEVITPVVMAVVFGAVAVFCVTVFRREAAKARDERDEDIMALCAVVSVLAFVASCAVLFAAVGSIAQLMNPEYRALELVLEALPK